jgi:hypothetical protein
VPAPAKKNVGSNRGTERQSRGRETSSQRASTESDSEPLIGEIRIEAGPAFSPATRLRVRGLNVLMQERAAQEKEKVSITLDKTLVDEIRAQFGDRALSTSINELLYAALAQERLAELVDDMELEAGHPSPEAFERVLAEWFADD